MSASDSKTRTADGSRRVLVVDDCADNADMMAEALGHVGYEAKVAYDGTTALQLSRDFKPHAVLLDIELPGMDGIELSRQLRALHGPQVTLIAISGYAFARYGGEAAAVGVQHYLLKPVELDRLQDLLRQVLADDSNPSSTSPRTP